MLWNPAFARLLVTLKRGPTGRGDACLFTPGCYDFSTAAGTGKWGSCEIREMSSISAGPVDHGNAFC